MSARLDVTSNGIAEILDAILYKRLMASLKVENLDKLISSSVQRIVDGAVTRAITDLMSIQRGSSFQAYCTKQVAKYAIKNKMNQMIEDAVVTTLREISPEIIPAIRETISNEIKSVVHQEFKRKLPEYVRSHVNGKINEELEKSAMLSGYHIAEDLLGNYSLSVRESSAAQPSFSDDE